MFNLLWKEKVHYRVPKGPLPPHIVGNINSVNNLEPYFLKVNVNIILLLTPTSSEWIFPSALEQ
jgi:hypothetical protein